MWGALVVTTAIAYHAVRGTRPSGAGTDSGDGSRKRATARETVGAARLLFGTDEPHRLDAPADILATVRARPWPEAEKAAVLGSTAERLFARATT